MSEQGTGDALQSPGADLGRVCITQVQVPAQPHFQKRLCTLLKPLGASPPGFSPEKKGTQKSGVACPAASRSPGMEPRQRFASLAFPSALQGNEKAWGPSGGSGEGIPLCLIVLRSFATG